MNLKENLDSALSGEEVDMKPVISVTQIGLTEAMEKVGAAWPEAHKDPELMVKLASAPYKLAGLECIRVPFGLTVEAEAMGATVDLGTPVKTPEVKSSPFETADDIEIPDDFLDTGRIPSVLEAIDIAKEEYPDVPIIVGTTGPFTLTGHLLGIENLVRLIKTEPSDVEDAIENCLDACMDYAEAIMEHEPDAICIAEPTASPELIDPLQFKSMIKPALEDYANFIEDPKSVLHICGNSQDIVADMATIGFDGISIEEAVNIKQAREDIAKVGQNNNGSCAMEGNGSSVIVGNISTSQTLFTGSVDDVKNDVKQALDDGVDVLAPSCGLAPGSPIANVKAMVEARNEYYN